jgi:hypothetical protein
MTPVDADVMQRSTTPKGGEVAAGLAEKGGKLGLIHLPAAIGKGRR